MGKGIFIVLDGLDGSGKSSMVEMLREYISSKNKYNILVTREPTDGRYGSQIRKILAEEKEPNGHGEKMLELFIQDRQEHLESLIVPFLVKGKKNIVICDRYYYSTIAFQSTQGIDMQTVIDKNKNFLKPDITFIMDIEPEAALERIKDRKKEKFEQLEFMKGLRKRFLELPNILKDNIKVINASKSQKEIFEEIMEEVDKLI